MTATAVPETLLLHLSQSGLHLHQNWVFDHLFDKLRGQLYMQKDFNYQRKNSQTSCRSRLIFSFVGEYLKILFKNQILAVKLKYLCKLTNECKDRKPVFFSFCLRGVWFLLISMLLLNCKSSTSGSDDFAHCEELPNDSHSS